MVAKYKELNRTYKQTVSEKEELANELARLKALGGGNSNSDA
jgi:hypothetical protein